MCLVGHLVLVHSFSYTTTCVLQVGVLILHIQTSPSIQLYHYVSIQYSTDIVTVSTTLATLKLSIYGIPSNSHQILSGHC